MSAGLTARSIVSGIETPDTQLKALLFFLVFVMLTGAHIWWLYSRIAPKIELVFDPDKYDSCQMDWQDSQELEPGGLTITGIHTLYRVGVRNLGTRTIDDVTVSVREYGLTQGLHYGPVPLGVMNTNPPTTTFTLHPSKEPSRFIDVCHKPGVGEGADAISLGYLLPVGNALPGGQQYTLHLEATGRDVPHSTLFLNVSIVYDQLRCSVKPNEHGFSLFGYEFLTRKAVGN